MATETSQAKVLEIKDLVTRFYTTDGIVKAVDGVSYDVHEGEIVGVVGESGSGKSVTALSVMRLIPPPGGRIEAGPAAREITAFGRCRPAAAVDRPGEPG